VVRGAARVLPISGPIFLAAFLAITGSPPFAPFFSEFAILAGAVKAGAWIPAAVLLLALSVIFVGMGVTVLGVVQGTPLEDLSQTRFGDSLLTAGPPLALMLAVLALGIWVPRPLRALFEAAAASLGG
jgi:hydrogenase-4 component F